MYKQLDCIKTLAQHKINYYASRKLCPKTAGVYMIMRNGICCYVGQSNNVKLRCSNHVSVGNLLPGDTIAMIEVEDYFDRKCLEVIAINALRPHSNIQFIVPVD